jgi:prepilin-type N-terminal cleavage/methylation domain-containing protein
MKFKLEQTAGQRAFTGFTLVEVMMTVTIFALVAAGVVYGYTQADRSAEWSSMSLAAQSLASEGLERARSATWETEATSDTTADDIPPGPTGTTNFPELRTMEIPASGTNFTVTNYISITTISANPPVRQILAYSVWRFPLTGKWFTNTLVTQRASN